MDLGVCKQRAPQVWGSLESQVFFKIQEFFVFKIQLFLYLLHFSRDGIFKLLLE